MDIWAGCGPTDARQTDGRDAYWFQMNRPWNQAVRYRGWQWAQDCPPINLRARFQSLQPCSFELEPVIQPARRLSLRSTDRPTGRGPRHRFLSSFVGIPKVYRVYRRLRQQQKKTCRCQKATCAQKLQNLILVRGGGRNFCDLRSPKGCRGLNRLWIYLF